MAEEIVANHEWRDIPEWPGYRVSKCGIVQSCKIRNGRGFKSDWTTLKPRRSRDGYISIGLKNVPKRTFIPIHVIVLMAWVGPRPDGMLACHNDGNKGNNTLKNLRWDTPKANAQDAIKHGTWLHGEIHPESILNDQAVVRMYELLMQGHRIREVGEVLGFKVSTLHNIVCGKAWKHVPRPAEFDAFWADAVKRGNESRRIRKNVQCRQCNQTFSLTPAQLRQRSGKYCSRNCYLSRNRTGAETAHTP